MTDLPTRRLVAVASARRVNGDELADGQAIDAWIVERRLAGGGFGTVYAARHRDTGERVALKLLHAHLMTSAEMVARFHREIQLIRQLEHPSIVRLVAAGAIADGRPYMCMELLDGEDLGASIARHGHLSPAAAVAVLEALCDALAIAHERGIVHRDIKAANVRACAPAPGASLGRIVLLDFGIAKLSDAFATELTATSQTLGTPSCMAPEQIRGRRADARTDVYALGALLYHMLTGQPPLLDPSPTLTQYLHLHAKRPRASAVVPIANRFDDVVIRAMAIDPAERFADVRDLLAAARAAVRASSFYQAVEEHEVSAILVAVRDRGGSIALDEAVLQDLEAVMPEAERALGATGFAVAVDLSSSAVFVGRVSADAAIAAAQATWHALRHGRRHPRVQVGLCVHRGPLVFAGGEMQPSPLLRLVTWEVPDVIDGVWVTAALAPDGPKRIV